MKKEITYADYRGDTMNGVDRQFILQELITIPNRSSAIYTNSFGVEYYRIPIRDGIKMVYRDKDKIYLCFKQIPTVKKGRKFKGDSAGYVKDNADAVYTLNNI